MPSAPVAVIVETEVDDIFVSSGAQGTARSLASASQHFVRRPMRGLKIKKETFATISVSGPGVPPKIANSSVPSGTQVSYTSNFILQGVNESRMEKFQAITTFGAPYGFFFGEQPRMVSFQAVLLNTADFQWEVEWWDNYDNYFRGTQLTNRGMRIYLSYDDVILEGYLTQASTSKNSNTPYEVGLTFTMWVTNVLYLITPGDRKIDGDHSSASQNSASLEFSEIDGDGATGSGYVSVTEEVRARNISSIAAGDSTGLLSALRNGLEAVSDFVDSVGNAIDSALDYLYGRNMVVPAGFAGSEATAGQATFASGSGFEQLTDVNLGGVLDGSSINIKVPGTVTGSGKNSVAQDFYQNIDEYPARSTTTIDVEGALQDEFGVSLSGTTRDEQALMYAELAEATFSEFGYDITNEEGQYTSDTLRALGRATYAALSYAAMTSGLSQSAASLTVIGGTTGNTNAAEQQAAAEALS